MIGHLVVPRKWQLAEENILVDERECRAKKRTEFGESGPEITPAVEFLVDPGRFDIFLVVFELRLTGIA